jgi:hypothetical protein
MPTDQELESLKIRNDAEEAEAIESIRKAQAMLRNTCKNKECMNPRRNGSAWCAECAADYKNNQMKQ